MKYHFLQEQLTDYFRQSEGPVIICVPFISPKLITEILPDDRKAIIITSWRKDHLLAGVSKLELFDVCQEKGWTLFVNGRLHMKFYSNDLDSAWIGSANLTQSALKDSDRGNHEILHCVTELSADDRMMFYRIQAESTLVTEQVYEQYKIWFEEQELPDKPVKEDLELAPDSDVFHTSQLPLTDNPGRLWDLYNGEAPDADWELPTAEHDLAYYPAPSNLDKEQFCEIIKECFFSHPFISSFISIIDDEGMRFGAIKEWIQNNCTDVPLPYRRELTFNTQSLMGWITFLAPDEYEMVVPGSHSQVLRRKK